MAKEFTQEKKNTHTHSCLLYVSHHVTSYPNICLNQFFLHMFHFTEDWLTNSSFQVAAAAVAAVAPTITVQSDDEVVEAIDSDDEVDDSTWTQKRPSPSAKKRSKKKKKKRRKGKRTKADANDDDKDEESNIEFTGQEDYYVDKKPCYRDFATGTMDKRDVARYHINVRLLGTLTHQQWQMMYQSKREKLKRYFLWNIGNDRGDGAGTSASRSKDNNNSSSSSKTTTKTYRMTEDEFIARSKMFNKSLADDSNDIVTWLEYIRYQEHFYMKMTKVQLAERKMEILNRALHDNPSNDRLYREYISVLEWAYPSFEVSKFLDNLIQKGKRIANASILKPALFFHLSQKILNFFISFCIRL